MIYTYLDPCVWYHLNETTGSDMLDSSDTGIDGVITGSVFDTGKINGGYTFSGTQYVNLGDVLDFPKDSAWSINFWIKSTVTGANQTIISKIQSSGVYRGWRLQVSPGGLLQFEYISTAGSDSLLINSVSAIADGTWKNCCLQYDGSEDTGGFTLYVNGSPLALNSVVNNLTGVVTNTEDVYIGKFNGIGEFFYGSLDEIRFFSQELTTDQITFLYGSGSGTENPIVLSATMENSDVIKRSTLGVETVVTFALNTGDTLNTAIDITKYVTNLGDISETLSKSNISSGGVILPSLSISLDNSRGHWNRQGVFFKAGWVNNSVIEVETYYHIWDEQTSAYIDISPSYKYKGLIKINGCEWNIDSTRFKPELVSFGNMLNSETVATGTISQNSFEDLCYQMLHRNPFTKYFTIDTTNWEFGYDLANIVDNPSEWAGKKVKEVLDEIMELSGSIYYIDYDGNFIIEPSYTTSPAEVCTLRGDDIDVKSLKYDWSGHITAWKWNEITEVTYPEIKVEMNYTERFPYQYDYREKSITCKAVRNNTNRTAILNALLLRSKWLKNEVQLTSKWSPDIVVNSYVKLDVPEEVVYNDDNFIWNESDWNDTKYWGWSQNGITFSDTKYWKVIDIKRSADGEKMDLKLLQHTSDDQT